MANKIKEYVCVDVDEKEADPHHANWMDIKAISKQNAIKKYSEFNGTSKEKVEAVLKSKFIKL